MDVNADSDDEDKQNEAAGSNNKYFVVPTPLNDTAIPVIPSMSKLIDSSTSISTVLSYSGDMTFLDDQRVYKNMFGTNPLILTVHLSIASSVSAPTLISVCSGFLLNFSVKIK